MPDPPLDLGTIPQGVAVRPTSLMSSPSPSAGSTASSVTAWFAQHVLSPSSTPSATPTSTHSGSNSNFERGDNSSFSSTGNGLWNNVCGNNGKLDKFSYVKPSSNGECLPRVSDFDHRESFRESWLDRWTIF